MRYESIRNCVEDRQIKLLFHFTEIECVESILKNGLRSKKWLDEKQIELSSTRCMGTHYEGNEDAISLSISFPNYKMFYKLRMDFPTIDFIVIAVEVEELNGFEFNSYTRNASYKCGLTLTNDFDEIFYEAENRKLLKKCEPTNPQAEIQVFGGFYPIKYILVKNDNLLKELKEKYPRYEKVFKCIPKVFESRDDYAFWR